MLQTMSLFQNLKKVETITMLINNGQTDHAICNCDLPPNLNGLKYPCLLAHFQF